MGNFGKRPINDASDYKRPPQSFVYKGEQRLDRRPFGHAQRWVDPQGMVITLQMSTPGDPRAMETAERIRREKYADGWVEHAKCPLRHGHDVKTPALTREFKKMPTSLASKCDADPKVMAKVDGELHAQDSCPHIEWLIASRVKAEAAQAAKRNAARDREERRKKEADELQAAQLELAREQMAERKSRKPKASAE